MLGDLGTYLVAWPYTWAAATSVGMKTAVYPAMFSLGFRDDEIVSVVQETPIPFTSGGWTRGAGISTGPVWVDYDRTGIERGPVSDPLPARGDPLPPH
jgi:hypothetical protein